jgi:hypothetical protein
MEARQASVMERVEFGLMSRMREGCERGGEVIGVEKGDLVLVVLLVVGREEGAVTGEVVVEREVGRVCWWA